MNTVHKTSSPGFIGGVILILLGVLALLGNWLHVDVWGALGPFSLIVFGALFFAGMYLGGKNLGALAIPGTILVLLGLVTLVQSLLGNWTSWSYAWALFVVAGVGLGLLIFSWWSDKPNLKRPGYILIGLGLVLFLVFGTLFETMFSFGYGNTTGVPALLIGLGVVILVGRLIQWGSLIERLPPHNETKTPGTVDREAR